MERTCCTCRWIDNYGEHCCSCSRNSNWEPRKVTTPYIQYATVGSYYFRTNPDYNRLPDIKNVIFNDPATIVFWSDGTKTVVKCQDGELYDAEKGLAMAVSKKALGNKGNYCNVFKKWLPEEEEVDSKEIKFAFDGAALEREYKKALDIIQNFVSNCSAEKDE